MEEGSMFQRATKPLPQPTAISLGDSQVTHVQTVDGGLASNAGDLILTVSCTLAGLVKSLQRDTHEILFLVTLYLF